MEFALISASTSAQMQFNVDLYFTINMVVTIIKTTLTRKQT